MVMNKLTLEEQATNYETSKHIRLVAHNLNVMVKALLDRGENHDLTKLEDPEVQLFAEYTPKLSGVTYGSQEFNDMKKAMGPALDHHYANNRHHPEHFKSGINDMNLVDIMEMFCDWAASCKRHNDGNLNKSIEINGQRFKMSDQLVKIFENTVGLLE